MQTFGKFAALLQIRDEAANAASFYGRRITEDNFPARTRCAERVFGRETLLVPAMDDRYKWCSNDRDFMECAARLAFCFCRVTD